MSQIIVFGVQYKIYSISDRLTCISNTEGFELICNTSDLLNNKGFYSKSKLSNTICQNIN